MNEDLFLLLGLIFFVMMWFLVISESRRDDARDRNDMREFGDLVGRRSYRRRNRK